MKTRKICSGITWAVGCSVSVTLMTNGHLVAGLLASTVAGVVIGVLSFDGGTHG